MSALVFPFRHALQLVPVLRWLWIVVIALAASPRAGAQAPTAAVTYPSFSLADLQADFDQLRGLINAQHPRLYADRTELDAAFAVQRARLRDGLDELEFLRVLAPLVRRLNCGHTSIRLSQATDSATGSQRRFLPLVVKATAGRLFIGKAAPGIGVPLGAEIVSVNQRTAAALLEQLYDCLPADGTNVTFKQEALNRDFSNLYQRYVENTDTFAVSYLDPVTGSPGTATVAGVPSDVLAALRDVSPASNGIGWYSFDADHAYLAITSFNFYDAAGHTRFNAFVDEFFTAAAARGSRILVLDLRGNGGGDPYCGSYLFSHLIHEAHPYFAANSPYYPELKPPIAPAPDAFAGSMYFLINGGCFSTTGHLTSLLRYHHLGVFVGEETGGSFACTAANQSATLTRTRLRFDYSTQAFTTAVEGLAPGRGIMPDVVVEPRIPDYLAGRDGVREAAVSLFRTIPPVITEPPAGQRVGVGGTVVLRTEAEGLALEYQWSRNGVEIAGACDRTLVLSDCTAANAGDYAVVVSNPHGAVKSPSARVNVGPVGGAGRVVNMSVRTVTRPGDQVLIVGFVTAGGSAGARREFLVRALGPQLARLDVPNVLANPQLELAPLRGAVMAANDDWQGSTEIIAAGANLGAWPLADPASEDSAFLASLPGGAYSLKVMGHGGASGTVLAEVYDAAPATEPEVAPGLFNVSARAQTDNENPLICGFVISGATARTVLVRGLGPYLTPMLGSAALPDPRLTLFRQVGGQAVPVVSNDNWRGDVQLAEFARRVGAQPLGNPVSADAAVLVTLEPGVYSAHVTSATDQPGVALVEAYVP